MSEYIRMWLSIIENMNNTNTYKPAWGRALLDLIVQLENVEEENVFHFKQIGHKMLEYYWNQIYFFNLKQGSNIKEIPVIVQKTNLCIDFYKDKTKSSIPEWFVKAEVVLKSDPDFYNLMLDEIAKSLKTYVCHLFMKVNKKSLPVYILDKRNMTVAFTREQIEELKEYAFVLSQLLNYRWAQLLEKYNVSPRIASKVKGGFDEKIRRKQLTKYKNFLLETMLESDPIDFYTNEVLDKKDITVDHVIPWSFMYSDDIWNLVLTSRTNNSSKNNSVPSEETIHRLEERNELLLNQIGEDSSFYDDLKMAIDHDYVQKFYLSLKM